MPHWNLMDGGLPTKGFDQEGRKYGCKPKKHPSKAEKSSQEKAWNHAFLKGREAANKCLQNRIANSGNERKDVDFYISSHASFFAKNHGLEKELRLAVDSDQTFTDYVLTVSKDFRGVYWRLLKRSNLLNKFPRDSDCLFSLGISDLRKITNVMLKDLKADDAEKKLKKVTTK
jgi:hypothetical protein